MNGKLYDPNARLSPMSELDALLVRVCVRPDDDAPRLVVADWLDDHDRSDWAAEIRRMVASPAETRTFAHADPKPPYIPKLLTLHDIRTIVLRRGFVDHIEVERTWLVLQPRGLLFEDHPLTRVTFSDRGVAARSGGAGYFATLFGPHVNHWFGHLHPPHYWPVGFFPGRQVGERLDFASPDEASEVLSAAAVAFGRRRVRPQLPPLPETDRILAPYVNAPWARRTR